MMSRALPSVTGSQESGAGQRHFDWQDGAMTEQCGQAVVLASPSARLADSEALKTSVTCGRSGLSLSENAVPESSSASRLRHLASSALSLAIGQRLQATLPSGSMEYRQTWKLRATPSGRQYWAHTASGRRTSGSDCGGSEAGWPTPQAGEPNETSEKKLSRGAHAGLNLRNAAELVLPAGWVTPSVRDHKDTPGMAAESTNNDGTTRQRVDQLPRQVYHLIPGVEPSGSNAETVKPGVLSPDLPRWLMGYPAAWLSCVDWETLSSHK